MAEGNIKLPLCYFRHIWLIISWFPVLKIHFNLPKKNLFGKRAQHVALTNSEHLFPSQFRNGATYPPHACFPLQPESESESVTHHNWKRTRNLRYTRTNRDISSNVSAKWRRKRGMVGRGVGEWDLHVLLIMFMPSVTAAHDIQLPQIKIRRGLRENSDLFEE